MEAESDSEMACVIDGTLEVIKELGAGSQGFVYLMQDLHTCETYAGKLVSLI